MYAPHPFHLQLLVIQPLVWIVDIVRFKNSLYSFWYRDFRVDVSDDTALSNLKIEFGARLIEGAGNLHFPRRVCTYSQVLVGQSYAEPFSRSQVKRLLLFFLHIRCYLLFKKVRWGSWGETLSLLLPLSLLNPGCGVLLLRRSWRKRVVGYPYCDIAAIRASALRNFPMLCEAFAKCGVPPLLPSAF